MLGYIVPAVIFAVVFICLQKTFKPLYTRWVYPLVALVLAIMILIVVGWKQAGMFLVVQGLGYVFFGPFVKPHLSWSEASDPRNKLL